MNSSIKIAIVAAVAVAGLAACTSAPEQNAPVAQSPSPSSSQSPSSTPGTPPPAVVTEIVTQTVTNPPLPQAVVKTDNRPGYGALKLGMTLDEARATGQTNLTWESDGDGTCVGDSKVAISKKYGVVRITLPADAKTSKGIGVGSTFAEVKKAYPDASAYRAGMSAGFDSNTFYSFLGSEYVSDSEKVVGIKIGSRAVDCSMSML